MNALQSFKSLAVIASILLASSALSTLEAQNQPPAQGAANDNPTAGSAQSAKELQALVAPIALYPDSLVAQILSGATFPDQIAVASYWLQENKSLTGSALMHAVDGQSWDPSVKALTQFPSVLANMANNLAWTSSLGEAYHNQASGVMDAIQNLRAQAKAAGNLKSGSQITVAQQSPDVIVIQPANPQVVYVPVYDPAVVYQSVYVVPGYTYLPPPPGAVVAAGVLGFAAGIAIASHGGCCSWGWSSWNCGWHGTAVVYHGGAYYGNSAWHGGYYNGGYRQTNTNISGNTVNVNRSSQSLSQDRSNFDQSHPQASQKASQDRSNFEQSHPQATQKATQDRSNFDAAHPSYGSSSAQRDTAGHSNAFSGLGGHSGGFGNSGGWDSRAASSRGWGSMRAGGFGGGRFGGSGGFGGGRFGGFRR